MGAANEGLKESLIFSNGGKSQLGDYPGDGQLFTIGEDIYLYMSTDGVTVIDDPEHPGDVTWFDPKPVVKEEALLDLYFYDATQTLTPLYIYAWGTSETFGGWPGVSFETFEDFSVLGLELKHVQVNAFVGDEYHLIINNGNGTQLQDYDVALSEPKEERYLKITDAGVVPLEVVAKARPR
jgi:hypothetical protein